MRTIFELNGTQSGIWALLPPEVREEYEPLYLRRGDYERLVADGRTFIEREELLSLLRDVI